jgi:hypothetical protein
MEVHVRHYGPETLAEPLYLIVNTDSINDDQIRYLSLLAQGRCQALRHPSAASLLIKYGSSSS